MVIHNRRVVGILVLSIANLPMSGTAYGQSSGEAKVYRTQFIELHAKVQAVLTRGEQQTETRSDAQSVQKLREEIFALQKLAHRLGEEAERSNLDGLKSGRDSNKLLLLVFHGCEAVNFVLIALDSFLETHDRAFLGLAKDGEGLAKTVQKIL